MWKFILRWFKRKPKPETGLMYPLDELDRLQRYKNKQHEKAMKAPIDKTDKIRKAGW